MTLREKLADWLTGGKYKLRKDLSRIMADRCRELEGGLLKIAAQETPGANATVKRMAKIAREALE